jgi:transcriptional regulator GlxA family with amidase domain
MAEIVSSRSLPLPDRAPEDGAVTRSVVFAVFPLFQLLDLTGPLEVFTEADTLFPDAGRRRYTTEIVAATAFPVTASCGVAVFPHRTLDAVTGPIDTLVVVGGAGTQQAGHNTELIEWIRDVSHRTRRIVSVCQGAFLLARAGLLDGRRAVTHWAYCDLLQRSFPEVRVEADPIFVRDGDIWTSAGVTAGIDVAMALVEEDHGPQVARAIAKDLVVFVQRSGGQAQFSAQLAAQRPNRDTLREVQDHIAAHLDGDLSVPALAKIATLSERHFSRVFSAETGMTAAAYVEAARVEAAQRLLESTGDGLELIARACGFGTVETMHRSFNRTVRVTPGQYRRHFSTRI